MAQMAIAKINNDLKEIQHVDTCVEGVLVELLDKSNVFEWRIWLQGPDQTAFEKGVFKCKLSFPETYPMDPPALVIESEFWHPNVYTDGKVCISILHPPGHDEQSGERPEERWMPAHTAVTILMSVLSMLGEPNINSPANIDASVMWRDRRAEFTKKVQGLVKKANSEVPPGLVERIPHPDTDPVQRSARIAATIKKQNPDTDLFPVGDDGDDGIDLVDFDDDCGDGGDGDDIDPEADPDYVIDD